MEGAKARALVVMLLMMLVLQAGKPTAAAELPVINPDCFDKCYVSCVSAASGFPPPTNCDSICTIRCMIRPPPTGSTSLLARNRYFCHLGCASSKCSTITTPHNLGAATKEVEGCVNSCSESCTKHY